MTACPLGARAERQIGRCFESRSPDRTQRPLLNRHIEGAAEPAQSLVVDLEQVVFIDSPGLGTLIYCDRLQRERGGRLVLTNLSGPIRDLFELVRLGDVLEIE